MLSGVRWVRRRLKAIFFDYDDTLARTEEFALPVAAEVASNFLALRGLSVRLTPRNVTERYPGHNFRKILTTLDAEYRLGITPAELDQLLKEEKEAVKQVLR